LKKSHQADANISPGILKGIYHHDPQEKYACRSQYVS